MPCQWQYVCKWVYYTCWSFIRERRNNGRYNNYSLWYYVCSRI